MDRPASIRSWRLTWPLLALAAACAGWQAVRMGAASRVGDAPSATTSFVEIPPTRPTLTSESAEPNLFGVSELAQWLPPQGATRRVSAAGFPAQDEGAEPPAASIEEPTESIEEPAKGGEEPPDLGRPNPLRPADAATPPAAAPAGLPTPPAGPREDAAEAAPKEAPAEAPATAPSSPQALPLPEGTPLPPSAASTVRSEQLENIAGQADRQIRHGFELAGRGAYFAARAEFIAALRLLAQGLDAEQQTALHSQSLAAGLTALKEAEDFLPKGTHIEADLDLSAIIGSHRTPALKDANLKALAPLSALQCYFTFAQEQLAAAAGQEVAGSMALRGLGKLHTSLAGNRAMHVRAGEPKAMSFFQAALLVCPQNYMAANDLGVLLAQCGNYAQARGALEHSLSICPQATGWHNLAVVYQRLGQVELARRADWQAEVARRAEAPRASAKQGPSPQSVRWVDPQMFAQASGEPAYVGPAVPEKSTAPQKTAPQPAPAVRPALSQSRAPAEKTPLTGRVPWAPQRTRN
jgi:tetratricopeptide (TPR) repeat protein